MTISPPPPLVLLVEDNPDDELLTLRALQQHLLVDVVIARDGAEALDYLLATGASAKPLPRVPKVILLDLKLPKLDGLEVLRRLRADHRTHLLPVVILTSSLEEQDLLASYSLGANSYIRKPVDFLEFSDLLKQLETYWLSLNESPRLPTHPYCHANDTNSS